MGFLKHIILGNSIQEWAIALGIILGTFVATKIVYWFIANIIKKLTKKTKTNLDDVLIEKLEKPISYSILIFGYWVAIHRLNISNPGLLSFLEGIASLTLVLTLTSVASKVFNALVLRLFFHMLKKQREEEIIISYQYYLKLLQV